MIQKENQKAYEYLIKSNEKNPNQADTLNYLGFALRKLGNFEETGFPTISGKVEWQREEAAEYLATPEWTNTGMFPVD